MPDSKDDTSGSNNDCDGWRERLLFIGTQFSNLYTALLCAGRALPWAGPWRRTFSHRARLQWRLGWYNWEGARLVVGADGLSANTDRYVVRRVDYVHQHTGYAHDVPTRHQQHNVASDRCPATDHLAAVHTGLLILHWNQLMRSVTTPCLSIHRHVCQNVLVAHLYHAFLQLPFSGGLLLCLTEFILPPPHLSVKELPTQGGNSYDHIYFFWQRRARNLITIGSWLALRGGPSKKSMQGLFSKTALHALPERGGREGCQRPGAGPAAEEARGRLRGTARVRRRGRRGSLGLREHQLARAAHGQRGTHGPEAAVEQLVPERVHAEAAGPAASDELDNFGVFATPQFVPGLLMIRRLLMSR